MAKIQMCSICDEPTGTCEEDQLEIDGSPVCEECFDSHEQINLNLKKSE